MRKSILGQFCLMFVPVALLATGIVGSYYYGELRQGLEQRKSEGRHLVEQHEAAIRRAFRTMFADLKTLSEHSVLQAYLNHPSEQERNALAHDFLEFYAYRNTYDKVRLLDDKGMEVIRVDYNDGSPAILPDRALQAKADRYYFADTMRLGKDKIYVSPFDLTVEQGQIRKPYLPTIRVATPLFDEAGNKKGMLILNYRGQSLLSPMRHVDEPGAPGASIMLLNQQSYWLKGPDPDDEWGFMFKGEMHTFGRRFSEAWARMLAEDAGVFRNADGMFSFRSIYPLQAQPGAFTGSIDVIGNESGRIGRDDYVWKLVVYVPADQLGAKARAHLIMLLPYLLAMMVLFAAFALSLAWVNVKRGRCEDNVEHLAHYDILTELPNRRLLYDRLKQLMAQEERYKRLFAVLFINLSGFNFVNDRYGRDAGDRLLKAAGQRILGNIRKVDSVSRIGGDEFVVALAELNDPEGPSIVAEKIIASLSEPFDVNGVEKAVVGASVGIAVYPADGMDSDTLIKHANEAMYQAKSAGTNDYRYFSMNFQDIIRERPVSNQGDDAG